jgi:hypothetical protein
MVTDMDAKQATDVLDDQMRGEIGRELLWRFGPGGPGSHVFDGDNDTERYRYYCTQAEMLARYLSALGYRIVRVRDDA